MEGLENPPSTISSLMRFSFEPNKPLIEQSQELIEASKRVSTPIRYYASRQLLLPVTQFSTHEGSLQRIGRAFRSFNGPIHIAPRIRSKELSGGLTRYQLLSTNQEEFDAITSLEVKPDKNAAFEYGPLQQLPNEIEGQPISGHYLFMDIATDALIGPRKRQMVETSFVQNASREKFFVHTLALRAIRDVYSPAPSTQQHSHYYGDDNQLPQAV